MRSQNMRNLGRGSKKFLNLAIEELNLNNDTRQAEVEGFSFCHYRISTPDKFKIKYHHGGTTMYATENWTDRY